MTPSHNHSNDENVLLITVRDEGESGYQEGREALELLNREEPVNQPDSVTFPSEALLARTFNERTLELLRTITDGEPGSIRETARFVERDVKNVHAELTRLEAMGVIQFKEEDGSKRPVFPYDKLVITMSFHHRSDETATAAP